MWVLPSEYRQLLPRHTPRGIPNGDSDTDHTGLTETGDNVENNVDVDVDAGDGSDVLEVSARDLARRCLEMIGIELGLGVSLAP